MLPMAASAKTSIILHVGGVRIKFNSFEQMSRRDRELFKKQSLPIFGRDQYDVRGFAPIAPRPEWLPRAGPGQKNDNPLKWTLSIEQWIFFMRACMSTKTWKALSEVKGEYNINMYDVCEHFVKPWTAGTGCSIAILMNTAEQLPVEGMFSHAWAGSVVETYNCLQSSVNHLGLPSSARFFFCTFSMYQPEDHAPGGLTISEQLKLEPFANIIASKPTYGMLVLHTTISEVYDRLWVVHEADVGTHAQLQIRGLFDMYRWTIDKFEAAAEVKTKEGKVGSEEDRTYIDELIKQRGGYERLDLVIKAFRQQMGTELRELLLINQPESHGTGTSKTPAGYVTLRRADWQWKFDFMGGGRGSMYRDEVSSSEVSWDFAQFWNNAIARLRTHFRIFRSTSPLHAYPMGRCSFPLGFPYRLDYCSIDDDDGDPESFRCVLCDGARCDSQCGMLDCESNWRHLGWCALGYPGLDVDNVGQNCPMRAVTPPCYHA